VAASVEESFKRRRNCSTAPLSVLSATSKLARHIEFGSTLVRLEYLDVTVLRRGVGEVVIMAGRAPAC
jgi:hypothetical protein